MKIQSIDVRAVKVPLREAHKTASGVVEICPLVLISVRTDEGVRGDGIVFAYTTVALQSLFTLASEIAPMLKGEVLDPSSNMIALFKRFLLIGTQGFMGMVLAGFDMALWDVKARAANVALKDLLGGGSHDFIPYANVGYDGVHGSAEGAGRFAEQGFKAVKAKIGYPTVEDDIEVIRAMRAAVGPNVALMVDYNQSLDYDEAAKRLSILSHEGLTWIEEPIYSHDFAGYAALEKETGAPVQGGENWWGLSDFKIAFDAGLRARIMPDVQKCGGVASWMEIVSLASAHETVVSSHLWPEVSAQLLSVTPGAGYLEYTDWYNPVIKEPLRIINGRCDISDVIGSGVEIDDDAAIRFAA